MAQAIQSTSDLTKHGEIVLNPDGTNIGSSLPTGAATSDKQDTQTTLLQGIAGMIPSVYDYISLTYTDTNLTGVVFKTGGSEGTTVSTLTLGYDGSNNLTEVTKT